MIFRKCEVCDCTLDPGEGRLCDECLTDLERKQERNDEAEQMARATVYVQMELEEFSNG